MNKVELFESIVSRSKFGPAAKQAARLRIIERKPYAEIAFATGINRERIRQIEATIEKRMKNEKVSIEIDAIFEILEGEQS